MSNDTTGSVNPYTELWRQDLHDPLDPGNTYSPKVFVDSGRGRIGMEAGGHIMIETVEKWMEALEFYYRSKYSVEEPTREKTKQKTKRAGVNLDTSDVTDNDACTG